MLISSIFLRKSMHTNEIKQSILNITKQHFLLAEDSISMNAVMIDGLPHNPIASNNSLDVYLNDLIVFINKQCPTINT